jgi:virginiamycin B lyase
VSGPRDAGNGRDAVPAHQKRSPAHRLLVLLIGLLLPLALPAPAVAIDEYLLPNAGSQPAGITVGPDGALWFAEEGGNRIGRIDPRQAVNGTANGITEYAIPPDPQFPNSQADQITLGPDGRLWFTEPGASRLSTIDPLNPGAGIASFSIPAPFARPEGIVSAYGALWFTEAATHQISRAAFSGGGLAFTRIPTPTAASHPSDITLGPDGRLWFTEADANKIGALDPNNLTTGGIQEYNVPTPGSEPTAITHVPGAGLWFTESTANQIGQISTSGGIVEYPAGSGGPSAPSAIAAGSDGALWFTESDANTIGRITTAGVVTNHFPVPTPFSQPSDATSGPDGAIWFTEFAGNKIGRIDTAPPAPLPPPTPIRIPITTPSVVTKKKPACKVPKVKRLSVKKATKKLKKAKCKYRVRGKGYVVSTKPKAGKRTTKRVVVKAKPRKKTKRST